MRRGVGVALLLVVVAACSPPGDEVDITVSAAASLTEAAADLAAAFEAARDGVTVDLNLGGSATLVEQVLRGAPVDVLATADQATMTRAVEAGAVGDPTPFASNRLVVAAPAGRTVPAVADLGRDELLVGLCAPTVPCGAAATTALDALGVTARPDTEDADVRTLRTRLLAGELDVGVVYATDVAGTDLVSTALDGPPTVLVLATPPDAPEAARAFAAFVQAAEGQAILARHGFGPPPEESP